MNIILTRFFDVFMGLIKRLRNSKISARKNNASGSRMDTGLQRRQKDVVLKIGFFCVLSRANIDVNLSTIFYTNPAV